MYELLKRSALTLNHHVDIADDYAGNARLFEATGVGTLLVTDWKKNLREMFEPGKEVVAYRTPEECVEMIRYYLEHENERQAIARAGQQRTLRDHTCRNRMEELVSIVERHIRPRTIIRGVASELPI
jgi:spore maturation protein CgeB